MAAIAVFSRSASARSASTLAGQPPLRSEFRTACKFWKNIFFFVNLKLVFVLYIVLFPQLDQLALPGVKQRQLHTDQFGFLGGQSFPKSIQKINKISILLTPECPSVFPNRFVRNSDCTSLGCQSWGCSGTSVPIVVAFGWHAWVGLGAGSCSVPS